MNCVIVVQHGDSEAVPTISCSVFVTESHKMTVVEAISCAVQETDFCTSLTLINRKEKKVIFFYMLIYFEDGGLQMEEDYSKQ